MPNWTSIRFILTLIAVGLLAGACASPSKSDLATSSDDSDARRRARVHLELAASYLADGKTNYALDAVKQSLALDNTMYEAHDLRALVYMRMNEPALAEDGFRRALALQPQAASVQHNYGWFLCQQNRMNEAQAMFNSALGNPNYEARGKTWMTMGICQAKAGQMVEAERSLLKADQLEPQNPVINYNLALQFYKQGDFTRARTFVLRLNESQLANAESLWLGIRLARKSGDGAQVTAWSTSLRRRFAQSKEAGLLDKGQFDD